MRIHGDPVVDYMPGVTVDSWGPRCALHDYCCVGFLVFRENSHGVFVCVCVRFRHSWLAPFVKLLASGGTKHRSFGALRPLATIVDGSRAAFRGDAGQ